MGVGVVVVSVAVIAAVMAEVVAVGADRRRRQGGVGEGFTTAAGAGTMPASASHASFQSTANGSWNGSRCATTSEPSVALPITM